MNFRAPSLEDKLEVLALKHLMTIERGSPDLSDSATTAELTGSSHCEQAVARAEAEGQDLVICDTSGRLHTNVGLMEELAKCRRSLGKKLPGAPHETLLVLDGTTGVVASVET